MMHSTSNIQASVSVPSLSIRTASGFHVSLLNDDCTPPIVKADRSPLPPPPPPPHSHVSYSAPGPNHCHHPQYWRRSSMPMYTARPHDVIRPVSVPLQPVAPVRTPLPPLEMLVEAAGLGIHTPGTSKAPAAMNRVPRTSMANRKYKCNHVGCGKAFTTSGHLSRHQRIHTGEKNFVCLFPGCMSRFSRQDNMMQHYRTHLSPRSRRRRSRKTQKRPSPDEAAAPLPWGYYYPYPKVCLDTNHGGHCAHHPSVMYYPSKVAHSM